MVCVKSEREKGAKAMSRRLWKFLAEELNTAVKAQDYAAADQVVDSVARLEGSTFEAVKLRICLTLMGSDIVDIMEELTKKLTEDDG